MIKAITFLLSILCISFQLICAEELEPNCTVMIPMRDGVQLPTDIYLPSSDARDLPCILLRSPAGRSASYWQPFAAIAKDGFVVAIQDTRSVLDDEGKTFPFTSDGWGKLQDGYDAVEWLANSPYTNGKIGTWGSSALGITQNLMAPANPPHLKCQYIIFAAASLYHHGIYPGGQLLKNQAEGWLGKYARDSGVLYYISQRPFYNEFWKQLNSMDKAKDVHVPGLHIGGWYDTFLQGTLDGFIARQYHGGEGAKGQQKLVIGPWTHYWPGSNQLGDYTIPEVGMNPPYDISSKRWFDHYLKGEENGAEKLPTVIYYVMGPLDGTSSVGNSWQTADQWPVPSTLTPFYLAADRVLSLKKVPSGKISYQYNPNDPSPSLGGRNLFLKSGPVDQQTLTDRADTLVFTTPPLEQDTEITGNMSARLFFSSNQKDTDIIVKVCDVYPDGKSLLISEGSYRLGIFNRAYQPNGKVEVTVDLLATSIILAKGHAIRVLISSASFPRCEKNMNIGPLGCYTGNYNVARNTIFFGEENPSHLILPVVTPN